METRNKLRSVARKGNPKNLNKFLADINLQVLKQRINEPVDDTGATPLFECVKAAGSMKCELRSGYGMCCRTFVKVGANPNLRDKSERTCLHWAVANRNDSLVSILMGIGAEYKHRDGDGQNPFHCALKTGAVNCVSVMVKLHPEIVNVPDAAGIPPLVMALQKNEYEICKLLLSEGADVNIQETRSKRTALYYAIFLKQLGLFEEMLEKADVAIADHRKTTIIHRCCANPNVAFLKAVFRTQPEVPVKVLNMRDSEGDTAANTSCQNGNYEHLQILVDRGASLSTRDNCKRTALHHCADNLDTRCAELLLQHDSSLLNVEDYEGLSPLHMAVITGNVPLIKLLLKKGADLTCQDYAKHSVIHWATVRGLPEVLSMLIDYGADIHSSDSHHATPLHYAAQVEPLETQEEAEAEQTDVLRMLIQNDASVNALDDDGRSPLLWAASAGNEDACRWLMEAGAEVNVVDKHGLTALHCAASRGHLSTIRCLVSLCKLKVDTIDRNHCTALFYAITLGNVECVKLLVELGANLSHLDTRGRTPAHCAAVKGSVETLEILQSRRVDLWKRSLKGDLPLHEAAQAGHVDAVSFLLKNRPEEVAVDVLRQDGRSSLFIAALTNNVWLCKHLLDAGANFNLIMKSKGKYYTAFDAANSKGNKEAAEYIKSKGGKSGDYITQDAARIIQRNVRSKVIRPKSSKHSRRPSRSKSPGVNQRRKSSTISPYRERRGSYRPGSSNENVSRERRNTLKVSDSSRQNSRESSLSGRSSPTRTSSANKNNDRHRSLSPAGDSKRNSKSGDGKSPSKTSKSSSGPEPKSPEKQKPDNSPKKDKSEHEEHKNDESKTTQNETPAPETETKPKKQSQHSKLIEEVQASVRRFEAERKYIRQMHQMRRAQLYMGPMYDIGLYRHLQPGTPRPATVGATTKDDQQSLKSLSQWDEFVEDQCKFVSHIHEEKKPSYNRVRSAAQRQHRKLQSEANAAKKKTDNRCEKMRKQALTREEKLEAEKRKTEKEIEKVVKRTEEIYKEMNKRADTTIEVAHRNNMEETDHVEQEKKKNKPPKSAKSPRSETKEDKEKSVVSKFEEEEKERREKYRQWQKKRAQEIRQRLMYAYRPYLPAGLFDDEERSLGLDALVRSTPSRPATSYSYNSGYKSRPVSVYSKKSQRETRNIMTPYGSRKVPVESTDNKPYQNGGLKSHDRDPLVFVPPEEYEAREKERKQKERDYSKQNGHQRPIESHA